MDSSYLITVFVTLFVIMDPPGLVPAFVAVTQGLSSKQRRKIALRACLVAIGVLTIFAAFGDSVLEFIGISMHAFRVSGGVLLFLTALDMLFERRTQRREHRADEDDHPDPSVFPLAIPLIAGPGAIASVILLVGQQPGWVGFTSVVGLMIVVVAMVFVMFLISGLFERLLGKTGIIVVTRLFGMLLAALAVQFVLDGLKGFGFAG